MTTAREWLTAHQSEYTDRIPWIKDCVKELNISYNTVATVAKDIWPVRPSLKTVGVFTGLGMTVTPSEDPSKDIIPPDKFLSEIDVVAKVLQFLSDTVGDGYIEDDKLRRRFEVSQPRWKEMTKLPVMEGRSLTYEYGGGRRKTVWSSPAGIEAARKTISMARYEL